MTSPIPIDVSLRDIRHFFTEPAIDPFDGETIDGETIDVSGIDQILDTLKGQSGWRGRAVQATLRVPRTAEAQALAPRMPEALASYCDKNIQHAQRQLKQVRIEGRRALWVGAIFLAFCLAMAALSEKLVGSTTIVGRLLVESFVIAGWVGLWRPIELLLFEWWPHAQDIKLYRKLRGMRLDVQMTSVGTGRG